MASEETLEQAARLLFDRKAERYRSNPYSIGGHPSWEHADPDDQAQFLSDVRALDDEGLLADGAQARIAAVLSVLDYYQGDNITSAATLEREIREVVGAPAGTARKGRAVRRAGGRWRLLVHEWRPGHGYGTAHDLRNYQADPLRPIGYSDEEYRAYREKIEASRRKAIEEGWARYYEIPGTEFDELVVGRGGWLHVEQMDTGCWWMSVGRVVIHIWVDRDGKPRRVTVHGPGQWDEPYPGCAYELYWADGSVRVVADDATVERLAKAVFACMYPHGVWNGCDDHTRSTYRRIARAALAALTTPNPEETPNV